MTPAREQAANVATAIVIGIAMAAALVHWWSGV